MDAMSDYFDSRSRRSQEGSSLDGNQMFSRALRRTLPFQLVPQPPLAYARSNNYVGEPRAVAISTDLENQDENLEGKYYQNKAKNDALFS